MSVKIPFKAKESLRDALIEAGLVTPEQLQEVAKDAKDTELGQLLVDQGIVAGRALAKVVAKQLNLPYVNLNTY